jgi:multiple sugar transport system substrate-binding protein
MEGKQMMKMKGITTAALALALSSSMIGCSSQGGSSQPSSGATGTAGTTAQKQVTVTVMSAAQTEKPGGDIEKQIADAYMKEHPNVKIEFVGVPMNDMYKKIQVLAAANQLPDLFVNTPEFMYNVNQMNAAEDLTKLLGADYLKEYYQNVIDESSIDGKLQFLPWTSTPQALIYRTDMFDKEGLKAPETWDDFLAAAQKITKDTNGDGKPDQWGFAMIGTRNTSGGTRFLPVLRSFGAEEVRKDASGKWVTDLDTPKAKEALQFYADLNNKYGVVPPGVTETGFPEAASLVASGKAAMLISGPNALGTIISQNPDLKGKLASAPIPMKEKHTATFGLLGYSIASTSQNKQAAADYLKYLLNDDNVLKVTDATGPLPTKVKLASSPSLSSPDKAGFVKSLQYAYHAPTISTYSQFYDIVAEAYQSLLATGTKLTADDAMKKAAARANELIANEGK